VSHSIQVIAWRVLSRQENYRDLGGEYFSRHPDIERRQRPGQKLQALGYVVTLRPPA
jgi:transposase